MIIDERQSFNMMCPIRSITAYNECVGKGCMWWRWVDDEYGHCSATVVDTSIRKTGVISNDWAKRLKFIPPSDDRD